MQSVTFLTADTCLTADQGVVSSIPVRSHTFMKVDHEIISSAILLPSTDSLTKDCPNMTIAVDWDVKNQTKPKKHSDKSVSQNICVRCSEEPSHYSLLSFRY